MLVPRTALALVAICTIAVSPSQSPLAQPQSEDWPQRTVRIVLPLPAGGGTDLAARLFAERLASRWRQAVIVDNRPGADGIAGVSNFVAARDGHTLLFSFAGPISINPLVHAKLPYDPVRDLVPIASAVDNFFAIAASTSLNVDSLQAFVDLARRQPGKLNWAATAGLPQYIFAALQRSAGIDVTEVPYRDIAPALQDLGEGRVDIFVTTPSLLMPQVKAGKARILMVTNRQRSPLVPDAPTAIEAGYPELLFEGVVGFFGWRGIPEALRDRISYDVLAVARDETMVARLRDVGVLVRAEPPAAFSAAIEQQSIKLRSLSDTARPGR
jgi:tripartite-type tricarboxylate transporter receptor subunit TctC